MASSTVETPKTVEKCHVCNLAVHMWHHMCFTRGGDRTKATPDGDITHAMCMSVKGQCPSCNEYVTAGMPRIKSDDGTYYHADMVCLGNGHDSYYCVFCSKYTPNHTQKHTPDTLRIDVPGCIPGRNSAHMLCYLRAIREETEKEMVAKWAKYK
jgi:hypothetical protein